MKLTAKQETKIAHLAKVAALRYKRRCWWAPIEDLEQEAWIAALLATRSFDPTRGTPFEAYAWRAMVRWLRGWLLRNSSPATVPQGALEEAKGLSNAGEPKETLKAPGQTPEEALLDEYWRVAVRRAFREVEIVGEHREGLAEEFFSDEPFRVRNYADRRGVSPGTVSRAKERLFGSARTNYPLYRLWKERG